MNRWSLYMTIRFPEQILHLLDSTLSLPITFMVVGAGHLVNDVIVAAPVGEILVLKARTSIGPYVRRLAVCPDPVLECRQDVTCRHTSCPDNHRDSAVAVNND